MSGYTHANMNKFLKVSLAVTTAAIMTAAIASTNVTGAWKGKILLDVSKMPKAQNPQQQQMMDGVLAGIKKMSINLSLNANKTFTMSASGLPQNAPNKKAEGTWTQSGNALTLKITKEDGKAPTMKQEPQVITVSADGKTLTMVPKNAGPMGGKIVFTR